MTDIAKTPNGTRAYRAGVALAVLTSLLIVWTTIVRDDSNGAPLLMIIMAIGAGWFAALFEPAGMARAMAGVSVMQMALGLLVATAPVTANVEDGPFMAILYNGFAAALWLVSAALFQVAAIRNQKAS